MLDEIEHFIIEDLQRGFISQEPKVVPRPELGEFVPLSTDNI